MKSFAAQAQDFAADLRGNVAMLFAILVVPLLFVGGAAIDYARSNQIRAVYQEAADTAALRIARLKTQNPDMTNAEMNARARDIFEAATKKLTGSTTDSFAVIHDTKSDTFRVDVDARVKTSLLKVAGLQTLGVAAASEVSLGKPPYIEVAMALDNTGSMKDFNKIGALKDASAALVESLFASSAEVKIGLVPFAQYVNVGAAHAGASWLGATPAGWSGCVGSRNYPLNVEDGDYAANPVPAIAGVTCPAPILPLTDDKASILAAIKSMKAEGWTYIAEGAAWGWRILSPGAPFSGGLPAAEVKKRDGIKALILLTDGENTRAPTYPLHNSASRALADQLTRDACREAKKDGVVIYTVAFNVSEPGVRALLEDCGTTPANYFEPANSAELAAVFARIAASLRSLSLSR